MYLCTCSEVSQTLWLWPPKVLSCVSMIRGSPSRKRRNHSWEVECSRNFSTRIFSRRPSLQGRKESMAQSLVHVSAPPGRNSRMLSPHMTPSFTHSFKHSWRMYCGLGLVLSYLLSFSQSHEVGIIPILSVKELRIPEVK